MGQELTPRRTPWGEAWNPVADSQAEERRKKLKQVCRLWALLERLGVTAAAIPRMVAHGQMAAGWRQLVWHFNAWGVKRGQWAGDWYKMNTQEEAPDGTLYPVPGDSWRAFGGWGEALRDYQARISTASKNEGYRRAAVHLIDPRIGADSDFWRALGEGGYYTDTRTTPERFENLVALVRSWRNNASENMLEEADQWAAGQVDRRMDMFTDAAREVMSRPFVLAAVAVLLVVLGVLLARRKS